MPHFNQPVRVSTRNGHFTMTRRQAHNQGARVLDDHTAVDTHGRWLPPKRNLSRPRDEGGRFTSETPSDAGTDAAGTPTENEEN